MNDICCQLRFLQQENDVDKSEVSATRQFISVKLSKHNINLDKQLPGHTSAKTLEAETPMCEATDNTQPISQWKEERWITVCCRSKFTT